MKKLLAIALLVSPTLVLAAKKSGGDYPMAGCGLAYILFSKDDNSKPVQVLAGTTNNIYGTQSFAITSGTSGCTEGGVFKANREAEVYAEVNFRELKAEVAAGGGEYLDGLAALLNVPETQRSAFGRLARARYADLFPSSDAGSMELLSGLSRALQDHPELLG